MPMTPQVRSFFICSLVAVCFISLYHILPFGPSLSLDILSTSSTSSMSSQPPHESTDTKLSGFISRAELLPPSTPTPSRSKIELIAILNSPAEHAGISLILFNDNTLLSAQGAYYKLAPADYTALYTLAQDITRLPSADTFRNTWRVKHERTSRPIDRFLVARRELEELPAEDYEVEFFEIGIYGWDKERKALETPVHTYTEIAPDLHEIGGVVQEARVGADGERNEDSLKKARVILGNVF